MALVALQNDSIITYYPCVTPTSSPTFPMPAGTTPTLDPNSKRSESPAPLTLPPTSHPAISSIAAAVLKNPLTDLETLKKQCETALKSGDGQEINLIRRILNFDKQEEWAQQFIDKITNIANKQICLRLLIMQYLKLERPDQAEKILIKFSGKTDDYTIRLIIKIIAAYVKQNQLISAYALSQTLPVPDRPKAYKLLLTIITDPNKILEYARYFSDAFTKKCNPSFICSNIKQFDDPILTRLVECECFSLARLRAEKVRNNSTKAALLKEIAEKETIAAAAAAAAHPPADPATLT